MTTKELAMQRFKTACENKLNNEPRTPNLLITKGHRQIFVETQFSRNLMELDDEFGRLTICNHGIYSSLIIFNRIIDHNDENYADYVNGVFKCQLSQEEYNELEKAYLG